jgi:protein-S-isoprenylcysteine O-methyltransferase Ste14
VLHTLRILATVLALAPVAAFVRGSFPRGRHWVLARHRTRVALFAVELALVALWALASFVWRLDPGRVPAGLEPAVAVVGGALAIAGGALAGWGKARLGRLFSPTFGVMQDHALVTDGPFAIVRHPLYTGLVAWLAGLGLLWNHPLTCAFALALLAPLWAHTVVEERIFAAYFGAGFEAYRRRVPRLVPGWGAWRRGLVAKGDRP